jgi:hypothetical protein
MFTHRKCIMLSHKASRTIPHFSANGNARTMQAPMGRGGVVALNNLRASGVLTLAGQFIGNRWV